MSLKENDIFLESQKEAQEEKDLSVEEIDQVLDNIEHLEKDLRSQETAECPVCSYVNEIDEVRKTGKCKDCAFEYSV